MITRIIKQINETNSFNDFFVVTNDVFIDNFEKWKNEVEEIYNIKNIKLCNDGVNSDQDRLGAVGDINKAIEHFHINEPLMVIGGDNYFEFNLNDLINTFNDNAQNTVIALHEIHNKQLLQQYGVVLIDRNKKVKEFHEKPEKPKSSYASTACYIFSQYDLEKLKTFSEDANQNKDNLGNFIKYLIEKKVSIYAHIFKEEWVDVGDYDQYLSLNQKKVREKFESDHEFKERMEAIIIFADIIGSVTISEHTQQIEYDNFISEFQKIALDIINGKLNSQTYDKEDRHFLEYSTRGDEVCLILYTKNKKRDIKTVFDIAIELKRTWFLSDFNRTRIKDGKDIYDIGIGIHYGGVVLAKHPILKIGANARKFNAEGYAINLAKRIE